MCTAGNVGSQCCLRHCKPPYPPDQDEGDVWDDRRCILMVALLPSGLQSVSDHQWCDVSLQAPEHRTASRLADRTLRLPSIQLSTLPYSSKAWSGDAYMYADDTQLYLKFKAQEYNWAILKMEECLVEIRAWMSENLLKLNDSKTEFMVIGKTE